ncbi:MAG: hypothetical protein ACRDQZ_25075 [Mycobacteriales bacterium]
MSIANNDPVGEVEDVIALIVTPTPEHCAHPGYTMDAVWGNEHALAEAL